MKNRRSFIKNLVLNSVGIACYPQLFAERNKNIKIKKIILKKGDSILFYGDSITDGNRNKENNLPSKPDAMGGGYAMSVATTLSMKYPNMGFTFYNRGINGNKTEQMIERLEKDCVLLKPRPTVITLLTGINDYSLSFSRIGKGNPEKYERDLRELLRQLTIRLLNVRLILMEPFAFAGIREKIDQFLPDFYSYQPVAERLAREFGAAYIPLQSIFNEAIKKSSTQTYSTDGVHPASAGIELIKRAWFDFVEIQGV